MNRHNGLFQLDLNFEKRKAGRIAVAAVIARDRRDRRSWSTLSTTSTLSICLNNGTYLEITQITAITVITRFFDDPISR